MHRRCASRAPAVSHDAADTGKASGAPDRRHGPDPVRYMYAALPRQPARGRKLPGKATKARVGQHITYPWFQQLVAIIRLWVRRWGTCRIWPTYGPRDRTDGFRNLSFCTERPVTHSSVTGFDLRRCVAGVGFEPT